MKGINLDELYEFLTYNREIEFEYNGTTYAMQPEVHDGIAYLLIWDCTDPQAGVCIVKKEIPMEGDVPREAIDYVLNAKCFHGKSFLEVEKDIEVTVIF